MLKENAKVTDVIIQLISTMPDKEKEKIARSISKPKTRKTRKRKIQSRKIEALISDMKKTRGRLPNNYKFDREEANER